MASAQTSLSGPRLKKDQRLKKDVAKILFAFCLGLITFFEGPLVLSRLRNGYERRPLNPPVEAQRSTKPLAIPDALPTISTAIAISSNDEPALAHQQEVLEQGWLALLAGARKSPSRLSARRYPITATSVAVPVQQHDPNATSGIPEPGTQFAQRAASAQPVAIPAAPPSTAGTLASTPASLSEFTILPETPIHVRMNEPVSNKQNRAGETFRGTLTAPLTDHGHLVAQAGATVLGRIVDSRKAGFLKGHANLSLELTDISTTNGQLTKVRTTQWYQSGSHSKLISAAVTPSEATGRAVVGAVSGLAREAGVQESPERSVIETKTTDNENTSRKGLLVVPAGAELSFRLVQPLTVSAR